MRKLVIIDTDAGGDDAVAVLLALAVEEVQVLAITCSYGNTHETNVETNVLKILTVANRIDIPVYGGAKKPLVQDYAATDYFGKDGFGDFKFDREIINRIDRSKHASIAMIDLAKKYPGEIHIITLGPLTNVALAASMDPNFTENVNRFYVMGARIDEPENAKDTTLEFNFSLDPEGNAIFLNSRTNLRTLITPWDIVHSYTIDKKWRTEVLGSSNSAVMKFLNKAESTVLQRIPDRWSVADSIAVASMIWPELVTDSLEARMTANICGQLQGSVRVEPASGATNNVEIIRALDIAALKNKLLRYLA